MKARETRFVMQLIVDAFYREAEGRGEAWRLLVLVLIQRVDFPAEFNKES